MPRRPPTLFESLRDNLLDLAEDLISDVVSAAQDAYRTSITTPPPANHPHTTPRPGMQSQSRSTGRTRKSTRPKSQERQKTSPGVSLQQDGLLYDRLEISISASPDVVAAAYKSLARRYHPDMKTGDKEKMQAINEAHEILSDPKKRKQYDRSIGISR